MVYRTCRHHSSEEFWWFGNLMFHFSTWWTFIIHRQATDKSRVSKKRLLNRSHSRRTEIVCLQWTVVVIHDCLNMAVHLNTALQIQKLVAICLRGRGLMWLWKLLIWHVNTNTEFSYMRWIVLHKRNQWYKYDDHSLWRTLQHIFSNHLPLNYGMENGKVYT